MQTSTTDSTMTKSQTSTMNAIKAGGGKMSVDTLDGRSINALEKRGYVSVVEKKTGDLVKITAAGRKALN